MLITEDQLSTWSNQGATSTAEDTHKSVRNALAVYTKWPNKISYDVYLQGSYRNSTNIYGNSDVDLVVELTSVFWSNLTEGEKQKLELTKGAINLDQFRQLVISAFIEYYGAEYLDTNGDKSLKVLSDGRRLKADVVVAATYKYYENLRIRAEGITFWTQKTGIQIINYPKLHFNNGADKNSSQRTNMWYRRSTRMFKNAREKIYSDNPSIKGKYPSYFIECLLYNVPDVKYGNSYQDTYADVVNWLNDQLNKDDLTEFVCQNGMYYLFGPLTVQWNATDARHFVQKLIDLWNNW
jgi:hypothetical protein